MAVDKHAAIGDAFGPRHSSDIAIRKQTPYRPTTHTRPQKFYTSAIGLLLFFVWRVLFLVHCVLLRNQITRALSISFTRLPTYKFFLFTVMCLCLITYYTFYLFMIVWRTQGCYLAIFIWHLPYFWVFCYMLAIYSMNAIFSWNLKSDTKIQ
jgi:hypothetical protein